MFNMLETFAKALAAYQRVEIVAFEKVETSTATLPPLVPFFLDLHTVSLHSVSGATPEGHIVIIEFEEILRVRVLDEKWN